MIGHYIRIPLSLLKRDGLTPADKLVYGGVCYFRDMKKDCPGVRALGEMCNLDPSTVHSSMVKLHTFGLITVKKQKNGLSSIRKPTVGKIRTVGEADRSENPNATVGESPTPPFGKSKQSTRKKREEEARKASSQPMDDNPPPLDPALVDELERMARR
ncbi:MAG: hypothetical protein FJ278_00425 [Planctomycetes bacterium]|nr:hypothetical protein [Planctomycetota bacterium]